MFGEYIPDILANGFEQRKIALPPDYEGEMICTLVRKLCDNPTTKAALYIHGFNDYFFQQELAERFIEQGYNFYAIDLHKCGRSILPHQTPYDMRNVSEYFTELDIVRGIIKKEGGEQVALCGHSTGGLIAACYLNQCSADWYDVLVLNSPFLELAGRSLIHKLGIPIASFAAKFFPNLKIKATFSPFYGESLHIGKRGEWGYRTDWKPIRCMEVSIGWLRAVTKAHEAVKRGLNVQCPMLVLSSDKSMKGREWTEDFHYSDLVLNVDGIQYFADKLGKNVAKQRIAGGKHDLFLSQEPVRSVAYQTMFQWLEKFA